MTVQSVMCPSSSGTVQQAAAPSVCLSVSRGRCRPEESVLCRLRIDHTFLTHLSIER